MFCRFWHLVDCDSMLPEVFSDWVEDCSSRMPCPPDYIAVPAIVALSSVIGARCVVKPKMFDDWAIVPNLWGGIVGLPSAKKSPAIGSALKPLDKIIATAKERYAQELEDFESGQLINQLKLSALKDQLKQAVKESLNPKEKNGKDTKTTKPKTKGSSRSKSGRKKA